MGLAQRGQRITIEVFLEVGGDIKPARVKEGVGKLRKSIHEDKKMNMLN